MTLKTWRELESWAEDRPRMFDSDSYNPLSTEAVVHAWIDANKNAKAIALLLKLRGWLFRFEKAHNPQMLHNWRIALLFWIDKRLSALGYRALSNWYGDDSA
jgi:hypothetical protein